jgi:hypothetical protein
MTGAADMRHDALIYCSFRSDWRFMTVIPGLVVGCPEILINRNHMPLGQRYDPEAGLSGKDQLI